MKTSMIRQSRGVSLVELMVALAIGTVLILGLVQVFAASRAAYQMSEGLARVQENARFAMDFIQRDLRMAGHFGCATDQSHLLDPDVGIGDRIELHFPSPVSYPLNFEVSIQGYDATGTVPGSTHDITEPTAGWSPSLPAEIAALSPAAGSDVLVLRYLYGEGVPVDELKLAGSQSTVVTDADRWDSVTSGGVAQPLLFGLSDCRQADIFTASAAADGTVSTANAAVAGRYGVVDDGDSMGGLGEGQLRLFRAESVVYYIATGTSGEPSLFKARSNGGAYVATELVEGVENMQLLFGLDSSASGPRGYVTEHRTAADLATDANRWLRVGLVQVGFLAASPSAAASEAAASEISYPNIVGVSFDTSNAGDSRYRTGYEATVALRNRLFGN